MYQGDEDIYPGAAGRRGRLSVEGLPFPKTLIRVIREVHAGMRSIPPDILAKVEGRMGHRVLTVRELQVLELLGKGMRNKEVAARSASAKTRRGPTSRAFS